jgi:ferredoxin
MPDSKKKPTQFEIDLEPVGRRTSIEAGSTLLDAARSAGVELVSICGGAGLCDSCKIRLVDGELSSVRETEEEALEEEDIAMGFRLACQNR